MKPSHITPENNIRKTYAKGLHRAALLLAGAILLMTSGCGSREIREFELLKAEHSFDQTPIKKPDNEPFCIGFMDLGPPIESSYLCLKGLAEGLQSMGYIDENVDLSEAPEDFYEYYDFLTASDLGEYILFDQEPYMIGMGEDEALAEELRLKAGNGKLDAIVATGTDPGLFLKDLDLPVPFLVCLASDPVGAGIIESTEDTGDPDVWALVEPLPLQRQFEGYQHMLDFHKIALLCISDYDLIAGTAEYRDAAKNLDVELEEYSFTEEESFEEGYTEKLLDTVKSMDFSDLDAVLFGYGTIDENNTGEVCAYIASQGIPTLISDGDYLSREGALMCLSCFDYESYGNYASKVLSNVFHGQNAGDQPCVVQSSPHIVLNMTTAGETGFETGIDLLSSVDVIYR